MRVAIIGPPQSGKSTLFAAVAEAGGSHVDISRGDQVHLAVVKVPDERLDWLGEHYKPKKFTLAELEFLDLPGFDLTDEATRQHARVHWSGMRRSDMIVLVVRSFVDDSVGAYRSRIDPESDLQELLIELLFADLDQVTARVAKLQSAITKPTGHRDEQMRELELMNRLTETLEGEKPITEAVKTESEAKLIRSFAFLTQKPALVVLNCSEDDLSGKPDEIANLRCIALSAKIEEEIAQLPPADRGEFLADLGEEASARDLLIRACYQSMNLVSFFTVGEDECRAITLPSGTDALTAAGQIHSDMSRGFIRAETVAFEDFRATGGMKNAKAAGKVRLEGKSYVVQDGDIVHFRFNV